MKIATSAACLTMILTVATPDFAQESPEKEREIRKLFESTGVIKSITQMTGQMIGQYRKALPQVPQEFWDEFEKELDAKEIIDLMIPVYDKHLSLEDLKAVNAFYATPAGKRFAQAMPVMSAEGFEVGRKWGEAKGRLVVQRLNEKGLHPSPEARPPSGPTR
jgi:hypothetical protein